MEGKEQDQLLTELRQDVKSILQRLSGLEAKATIWGALGGIMSAIGIAIISWLKGN